MKKTVVLIVIVLLVSSLLFAENKQFIRVLSSGSVGSVIVSDGSTTVSSATYSFGTGFSTGWVRDSYSISLSSVVGAGGLSTDISFTKDISDALFFGLGAGITGFNGFGFSFGASFGTRFEQSNRSFSLALAAEFGYRSYSDYSVFTGVLGLNFNESVKMTDSMALGVGLTLGSIPLVNRLYDKDSKTTYSLSTVAVSFGLTTSLTYLY